MQTILTVNGGSSSLKCALFERTDTDLILRYSFKLSNILNQPLVRVMDSDGSLLSQQEPEFDHLPADQRHQACLNVILNWLTDEVSDNQLCAIGHRVVHGGSAFSDPQIIDDSLLAELASFIPLAPLHQPYNLKLSPETPNQPLCL